MDEAAAHKKAAATFHRSFERWGWFSYDGYVPPGDVFGDPIPLDQVGFLGKPWPKPLLDRSGYLLP